MTNSTEDGTEVARQQQQEAYAQIHRIKRRLSDLEFGSGSFRAQKKYLTEGVANELLVLNISEEEDAKGEEEEEDSSVGSEQDVGSGSLAPFLSRRRKLQSQSSAPPNPFLVSSTTRYRPRRALSRSLSDDKSSSSSSSSPSPTRKSCSDDVLSLHIPQEVRDYLSRPPCSYLLPKAPDNSKALIIYTPPEVIVSNAAATSQDWTKVWTLSSSVPPSSTQCTPSTPSPIEQEEVVEEIVIPSKAPVQSPTIPSEMELITDAEQSAMMLQTEVEGEEPTMHF